MKKISLSEIRAPHSVDDFRVNLLKYFNSSYSMSDKTIEALSKQGAYVGKKGSVIAHPLRTNRSGYMDVSEIDSIHDLAKKWYEENLHLFLSQMPGRPPVEDPPCDLYLEPLIIPLNTDGWLELNRLPETSLLGKKKNLNHIIIMFILLNSPTRKLWNGFCNGLTMRTVLFTKMKKVMMIPVRNYSIYVENITQRISIL